MLGVIAIPTDDVGSITPAQTPAAVDAQAPSRSHAATPVYEKMPSGWPATEVMRREAEAQARHTDNGHLGDAITGANDDHPQYNPYVPPIGESGAPQDRCSKQPVRGLPVPC